MLQFFAYNQELKPWLHYVLNLPATVCLCCQRWSLLKQQQLGVSNHKTSGSAVHLFLNVRTLHSAQTVLLQRRYGKKIQSVICHEFAVKPLLYEHALYKELCHWVMEMHQTWPQNMSTCIHAHKSTSVCTHRLSILQRCVMRLHFTEYINVPGFQI